MSENKAGTVETPAVETPAESVQVTAEHGPRITLADAKAGRVADVDAFTASVAQDIRETEDKRKVALYDAALGFHAIVTVGASLKQGDYVSRLGMAKSTGTMLQRLSKVAAILDVEQGSDVWAYTVQRGTSAVLGTVLKELTVDSDEDARTEALNALTGQAAEFREHGKVTQGARVPRPNDGTGETGAEETAEETGPEPIPATIDDVVNALDVMVRGLDREGWSRVEDRLTAIVTREVTIRTKEAEEARKAEQAAKAKAIDTAEAMDPKPAPKPRAPRKSRAKAAA